MIDLTQAITIEKLADAIADRLADRLTKRRKLLSREEYAAVNGLGVRTVDRAIQEGRLQVERIGRRVLIPADNEIAPSVK
jgi:excisionase family DNA binding protein